MQSIPTVNSVGRFPVSGCVLHWKDLFSPGKHKYLVVIGHSPAGDLLAFTTTTQAHWLRHEMHMNAMIEIPEKATSFMPSRCWIQCFFEVHRISKLEYEQASLDDVVEIIGRLKLRYLEKIRAACGGDLLAMQDAEDAISAIDEALAGTRAPG